MEDMLINVSSVSNAITYVILFIVPLCCFMHPALDRSAQPFVAALLCMTHPPAPCR